jgi:hypothetical protein
MTKIFKRGWSIPRSKIGVDGQGKWHQGSGTEADKGAVGGIYRRVSSKIIERGATIARYSASTLVGVGV